jgi:hypothetical protein
MRARDFWRTVTVDRSEFLDRLLATLAEHRVRYCVIGGQAVNAYVEPLVSSRSGPRDRARPDRWGGEGAGAIAAAIEPGRRPSTQRKDLLDVERLLEAYPALRTDVPIEILRRLS